VPEAELAGVIEGDGLKQYLYLGKGAVDTEGLDSCVMVAGPTVLELPALEDICIYSV
jgi:hypothetical protein